jgi:ABC-type phosphate transport system substrate-binding protein
MVVHPTRRKTMSAKRFLYLLWGGLMVALLGAFPPAASAKTLVIANEDVEASEIDKRELQKVFLGRSSEFGGQRVVLATLRKSTSHKEFTESYLLMTPQQFTNHWRKIVFSGTGKEPRSFDSEAELVAFVSKTPGAIGYISGTASHGGVKTLPVK